MWGEEGVKKKNPQKREKKSVCFTKPDLQQNCRFLKLHKMYQAAAFTGLAKLEGARHWQCHRAGFSSAIAASLGPRGKLMGSQANEYLILSLPDPVEEQHRLSSSAWLGLNWKEEPRAISTAFHTRI